MKRLFKFGGLPVLTESLLLLISTGNFPLNTIIQDALIGRMTPGKDYMYSTCGERAGRERESCFSQYFALM